jgi:hypothetical protein
MGRILHFGDLSIDSIVPGKPNLSAAKVFESKQILFDPKSVRCQRLHRASLQQEATDKHQSLLYQQQV